MKGAIGSSANRTFRIGTGRPICFGRRNRAGMREERRDLARKMPLLKLFAMWESLCGCHDFVTWARGNTFAGLRSLREIVVGSCLRK
jgi:hypothetical protein